ncbi:MAG TPA: aldehyde dehydrogenase family protein, partial [Paracoccaceae bacterium]|nr:aldehyde dehydrogenase family protein [Paracoccaceae bacterium]
AANTVKGLVLELGGKSAGIVLPGADLGRISLPLHGRYLRNAGQGCQSPTRLLVPQAMWGDFVDSARAVFAQIPVGDPLDPKTMAGPLITEAHRAKVEGHVARALAAGGEMLAGGGRPDRDRGWFMNGALIGGLGNDAEIAHTELFGPVALAIPYRELDEAVAIANDSIFGLAAAIFGPTEAALDLAPRLRAGTVQINGGGAFRVDSVLAGWKQSGIGREWGEDGVREFLETQHVQCVI